MPFRGGGEPILDLTSPKGVSPARQRQTIDATSYRIISKGTLLLLEEAPVDPLVEDERRRK